MFRPGNPSTAPPCGGHQAAKDLVNPCIPMTSAILHPHVILYSSIQDPVYSILLASSWDGGWWSVPRELARYPQLGVLPQFLGSQAARPGSPASQPGQPARPASSPGPRIQKIGPLGQKGIIFQDFLPPEGGPPARNPFKIRKTGPLEKQVSFFRIFCPRREDPRLVILLKSGKLDPWKNRCRFSDFFAPGGRTPGS